MLVLTKCSFPIALSSLRFSFRGESETAYEWSLVACIAGQTMVTGTLVMVDSATAAPTVHTGSVASGVRSSI